MIAAPDIARAKGGAWSVPEETGTLRIAVLGAGKMARVHLEVLCAISGVRVTAICNRSSDAGAQLASEFGVGEVYREIDRVLDTPLDAAIVAVSVAATADVTAQVLAAGIPCLVEKPAGLSSADTSRLANLAASRSIVNIVGLNRRFYSTVQQAQLAVLHHGPITGVSIDAHEPIVDYRSRAQLPAWLYDEWLIANSIHAIDLFRAIGGEPAGVHAVRHARTEPNGDSFAASIEFEGGALGSFAAHWHSPRGTALRIYGMGAVAELAGLEQGFVRYENGRPIRLRPDWADVKFKPGVYWQDVAFLQAVCDRAAPPFPASTLADNIRTMRLVEQIGGRAPARFN